MFLIANIVGSTVQITTLPLPVLSTLQASGLVFNTICATIILHEPFTRFSLLGTILVAGGAVLIGLYGGLPEPSHNLTQLLDLLARRNFLIWLFGTFFIVFVIIILVWFSARLHLRLSPRGNARLRLLQGMMYGAISGVLSAHSLLVAKSAVELLVRTIVDRHNQFNRWQSWMILVLLVVLALSQLYYLHRGLKLCSTSVLYPFVFCIYNIIAILDGLIYFRQTSRLPPLHAGLIAIGTVILLGGVVALSWRLDEATAYTPVATDETGRAKRVRSMSRIATPTIPQTVLAPGMGIVEGTPSSVLDDPAEAAFDPSSSFSSSAAQVLPDGEEAARLTESTPLLRDPPPPKIRAPRPPERKKDRDSAGSGTLRAGKLRRTTVAAPGAAEELWDELVENEGYRRRSLDSGTMMGQPRRSPSGLGLGAARSPASVRFKDRPSSAAASQRRGNGTVPGRRRASSATGPRPGRLLDPRNWPLFNEDAREGGSGSTRSMSAEDEAETDGSEDVADPSGSGPARSRHGRSRSDSAAQGDEGPGEWFKLRWWRKRWRNNNSGNGCGSGSGSGRGSGSGQNG